jgi:hypothetical protein
VTGIYIGNCVQLPGHKIQDMVDEAIEVEYEDIRKHLHQKELRLLFPGYDWETQGGLQLHNDHYVRFCSSKYDGKNCIYIEWSAIEFVWEVR